MQSLQGELAEKQTQAVEHQQLLQRYSALAEQEASLAEVNRGLSRDKSALQEKVQGLETRVGGLEQSARAAQSDQGSVMKELKEQIAGLTAQNEALAAQAAQAQTAKPGDSSVLSADQVKEFVSLIYNKLVELLTQLQEQEAEGGEKAYSQKEVVKLVRNVLKTVTSEYNNAE